MSLTILKDRSLEVTHVLRNKGDGNKRENVLVWKFYTWILRLCPVDDLLQALEERYHGEVEPPIVEQSTKVQITRAMKLVCRFVAGDSLDTREGTHGNKAVTAHPDQYDISHDGAEK